MRWVVWLLVVLLQVVAITAYAQEYWLSPLVSVVGADGGTRYEAALNSYVRASPDAAFGTVTAVARSASGHPIVLWGLVATCAKGLTPDPTNIPLPAGPLDAPLDVTGARLTALKAVLAARGMDGSGLTLLSTRRDAARIVLQKLQNYPETHLTWRGGACP